MRLLFALLLSLTAPAAAHASPEPTPARNCFASSNWQGWSAPGDGDVLYLRVGLDEFYRVELTPGTHVRKSGDRFLVNELHGTGMICSPLDLNLTLSDQLGFRQPLIATALRKLTAEEIAAIPEGDLPN